MLKLGWFCVNSSLHQRLYIRKNVWVLWFNYTNTTDAFSLVTAKCQTVIFPGRFAAVLHFELQWTEGHLNANGGKGKCHCACLISQLRLRLNVGLELHSDLHSFIQMMHSICRVKMEFCCCLFPTLS